MTKVDRAYTIQCFYMEADKTVSTDIEVSMITTGFQTQVVPMPICRYEILEDGPNGAPVQYALIGDQVYHKWTCDTETVDTFCMTVYSCFVDEGNGDRVDLIDGDGCANDRYLMNNLEYPGDLVGGVEAHVFKYTDRAALFFQCQINILVKEPNGECERPECREPEGRGGRKRRWAKQPDGITDVRTNLNTLDLDENTSALPRALTHRPPTQLSCTLPWLEKTESVSVAQSSSFLVSLLHFWSSRSLSWRSDEKHNRRTTHNKMNNRRASVVVSAALSGM